MDSVEYPYKFEDVNKTIADDIKLHFKGLADFENVVRIGPKGYLFLKTRNIKSQMHAIYNMPLKPNDIFVSTFPRSGTTLTQELVWLIVNDLDYATAKSNHILKRYHSLGSYIVSPLIELSYLEEYKRKNCRDLDVMMKLIDPVAQVFADTTDRRFFKNHLPLSLLPPDTLETAKTVYVARDPRDVAVSLYHLSKLLKLFDFTGDFKTFWKFFVKDLVLRTPYFVQVIEAWEKRDHDNLLFIFYEELSNDTRGVIQKLCNFFNKKYSEDQIKELSDYLKIGNFRSNPSVNMNFLNEFNIDNPKCEPFIRRGEIGGWRDYFDEDMTMEAQSWMEENLRNTDLRFPSSI